MIGSGYERRDSAPEGAGSGGQRQRVYELAKELNVPHKDLVAKIKSLGIEIANHMSYLELTDADRVRRALDRERHETLVEQRVSDTVIRRRSRTAAPAAPAAPPAPARAAAPAAAPAAPTRRVVAEPAPEPAPAAARPARRAPVEEAPAPVARRPEVVEAPESAVSSPPAPPPEVTARPAAPPPPAPTGRARRVDRGLQGLED
jgi:translation initiation factor IF-2